MGVVFGKSVAGIWATSSVAGLVLGFALRSMILDIFTGLAVNLDRSYQIGDWLEVHSPAFKEPVYGQVININWRTTRLQLRNQNVLVLPNSLMGVTAVTNYSMPTDLGRFEVSVTLDFSVPPERAMRVLLASVKAVLGTSGLVEDPEPSVVVGEISGTGVRYRVLYFAHVNQSTPGSSRHLVLRSAIEHLNRAGLSPAYPKQDVFNAEMPERLALTGTDGVQAGGLRCPRPGRGRGGGRRPGAAGGGRRRRPPGLREGGCGDGTVPGRPRELTRRRRPQRDSRRRRASATSGSSPPFLTARNAW